jgi:hypothetical protein
MPGKRGYWYAYEWVHRKWHAFSKAMFKYGERVTPTEFELIHSLKENTKRVEYMNWRLMDGCLGAIRSGITQEEVELVQF